jgi:ATP-dependent exoDNAse (exonuclease V) beta subunit
MLESYHLESITEDGLKYFLTNQGQKIASVTTILKVVAQYKGITMYGWKAQRRLSNWKLRIGEEIADQIRRDACARGTEFHQRIANYLHGGKGTQWAQDLLPFGHSIKSTLLQIKPVEDAKLVEGMVVHPKLYYAGKVDAIAKWQGKWSLIEWKTANRPQKREWIKSHLLQSAAYIAAANKTYNLDLKQSLIVIATPSREAQVFLVGWEELQAYFREWLSYVKFFWALQKSIDI